MGDSEQIGEIMNHESNLTLEMAWNHGLLLIYSQMSRCCTGRRSGTGFSRVSPPNFEACKSFLFTEKFPCFKNKEDLVDFVITLYSLTKESSCHL